MAKKKAGSDDEKSQELVELISIKRLLIFDLLRSGASQQEVAAALGVNQSSISRMFPGRPVKVGRKAND